MLEKVPTCTMHVYVYVYVYVCTYSMCMGSCVNSKFFANQKGDTYVRIWLKHCYFLKFFYYSFQMELWPVSVTAMTSGKYVHVHTQ